MEYLLIIAAAFIVATLTLFSGFGLGTLLMPFFAIFFPVEIAIAATATVHLANNGFKLLLMAKHAHWPTVLKFGLPALTFAVLGALLLNEVSHLPLLMKYHMGNHQFSITWVKLTMAVVMVAFAAFEMDSRYDQLSFAKKYLPVGGMLSGFFGGLSGHQGALRAAFLSKIGLSKEQFVGTSVVAAVMVDVFRISVYGISFYAAGVDVNSHESFVPLVVTGMVAAFAGSFVGARLIKKVTMRNIQLLVGVLMMALAILLGAGII